MKTISIQVSDQHHERLERLAHQIGLTLADLSRIALADWLELPDDDFRHATDYVLQKNAELYKRMS